jgi:hypothetical protein
LLRRSYFAPQLDGLAQASNYWISDDFPAMDTSCGERSIAKSSRLRIQKHAAMRLHYDLRFKLDGAFKS